MPTRSDVEVQQIFATCESCEFFDRKRKTCKVCGCKIRRDGNALTNKIKMATERCPKGKWGDEPVEQSAISSGQ